MPVDSRGELILSKRSRLAVEMLPGADKVGDLRSIVTQITLAMKRGRKGDKEKLVPPESPSRKETRQQ